MSSGGRSLADDDSRGARASYIMAVLLIVWSAWDIYASYSNSLFDPIIFARQSVPLIAAAIIIVAPRKNLPRLVGIVAVSWGIVNILDGYWQIDTLGSMDLFFGFGILFIGIGIALLVNGITYLRGMTRTIDYMMYSIYIMLGIEIVAFVVIMRSVSIDMYISILQSYLPKTPYYAAIIYFIVLLKTKGVGEKTTLWKISKAVREIKQGQIACSTEAMTREHLGKLIALASDPDWTSASFPLYSTEKTDMVLMLRRDDDAIMSAITSMEDVSMMNAFRFKLVSVSPHGGDPAVCGTVRLYGENGVFVQLIVIEKVKKTKRTVSIDRPDGIEGEGAPERADPAVV
jgi:hypothetical protein